LFLGSPVPASAAARPPTNDPKLKEWRLGIKAEQIAPFRKKFSDGGISIDILKVDNITKMDDASIDYSFMMAKALGARAISTEIPRVDGKMTADLVTAELKRLGSFADKHKLMVGYHGHTHSKEEDFMAACALAKYNGINLDIGHYVGGGNGSPVEFLKKHHDRVTHIHVKDKKAATPDGKEGGNTAFGDGDTPIKEVLRLIRDNKWNIQATIEFEYKVPAGSERMAEIAKCVKYCRDALV
jgi:sugar phosphate isomerase/epimerase